MGWGRERLGSGFSPSSQDGDWSYPSFLHFYPGCLARKFLATLSGRMVFWELGVLTSKALYNYLTLPVCGKEITCC